MKTDRKAYRIAFKSPVGLIGVGFSEKSVLCLQIGKSAKTQTDEALQKLGFTLDNGSHPIGETLERELMEYFNGERKRFTVKPEFFGSLFQTTVWKALYEVPFGKILSYGELAATAGRPKAARAVGTAMGRNRIPIIVPCHRIIASTGALGGFGCGLDVKRTLLEIEGVHI